MSRDPFAIPNRECAIALWSAYDAACKVLLFLRPWAQDPRGKGSLKKAGLVEAISELCAALDEVALWKSGGGTKETGT